MLKTFMASRLAVANRVIPNESIDRSIPCCLFSAVQACLHLPCARVDDRTGLDSSLSPYLNTFDQERKGGLTMQTMKNIGSVNVKSSGNGCTCEPLKQRTPVQM
jgi:hypothetical protein